MANWKEPKNDYKKEDQVVPEIFNNLAENERYLQEVKITTEQVQDAEVNSTQSATRENVGEKETVKGFFGKVRKWFADLKALAFKGTVGTADIDSLAVTSAKIASNAVTSAKIASNAVTTAKINAKAVTDEKINSVSASKVTGLAKVATSGDYNDLINKPSAGSGGFNFKRFDFYLYDQPSDIDEGIYLCFIIFTNRASITNVANLGLITCSPDCENGSYSGISSIYDSGEEFKIQLQMFCNNNGRGKVSLISSQSETECPATYGYDGDGNFKVTLIKLSDLGKVGLEENYSTGGGSQTWQKVSSSHVVAEGIESAKSLDIAISGLKVGESIKVKVTLLKVNMYYMSDSYFYNTSNILYGWGYNGSGWNQLQSEYDSLPSCSKEISTDAPFVTKVGLLDYSTENTMTIRVSCKKAGFLHSNGQTKQAVIFKKYQ